MIWRHLLAMASPAGRFARLSILIFHRVRADADPLFPDELEAAAFARLLAHIGSHFRVIDLEDGVRRLVEGTLPSRALALTFDDGYADNATVAVPLLESAGMPATVFVAAGYLDGGTMWNDRVIEALRAARGPRFDPAVPGLGPLDFTMAGTRRPAIERTLAALKYLPNDERERLARQLQAETGVAERRDLMMSSAQVAALAGKGFRIGAHTLSHPILARLDAESARVEIAGSKARLEAITGRPVTLFAYPNGRPGKDYGHEHVAMVRESGFIAAVSTAPGVATRHSDRFQLPRFTPWTREHVKFDLLMLRNLYAGREARVAA